MQRRDRELTEYRMLKAELPERRKRGRPQKRFTDVVKEVMERGGVTEYYTRHRVKWKYITLCCGP